MCPQAAEAVAICWSLQVVQKLKVNRIIIQFDALHVVDCINSISVLTDIGHIVEDCQ